ncbi:MAG: site-specific integrase [Chloroflexota bacterium]|nr:site-specific integrase [Chloroflexota bacterium]
MSQYLEEFVAHLQAQDASPHTVAAYRRDVFVFFTWLAEQIGQVVSNPVAEVKGVRQTRRVPKALNAQEVYKLQRTAAAQRQLAEAKTGNGSVTPTAVKARRDESLLNLLLYTGLRVGEVAALRVDDVVLNDRSGKVIVRSGRGRKYW